jgi:hypothetical protein
VDSVQDEPAPVAKAQGTAPEPLSTGLTEPAASSDESSSPGVDALPMRKTSNATPAANTGKRTTIIPVSDQTAQEPVVDTKYTS